jgi:hypothetical protein
MWQEQQFSAATSSNPGMTVMAIFFFPFFQQGEWTDGDLSYSQTKYAWTKVNSWLPCPEVLVSKAPDRGG